MKQTRVFGSWALLSALWVAAACGDDSESPAGPGGATGGAAGSSGGSSAGASGEAPCPAGTERCACYGNGTCNDGLTCASDLCVSLGTGGSAGDGATGGGSGATAGGAGGMDTGGVGGAAVAGASGQDGGAGSSGTAGAAGSGPGGAAGVSGAAGAAGCTPRPAMGAFLTGIQCEWAGPRPGEPLPDHRYVLATPMVADLSIDSGGSAEIVFVAYDGTDAIASPAAAPGHHGALRIISGADCTLLHTFEDAANQLRATAAPALADLDSDGDIDIVARRNDRGLVAYAWNQGTFELMWSNGAPGETMDISSAHANDGPSVHDLDDDGLPEVILREMVYNGQTGARISDGVGNGSASFPWNGYIPIVADVDDDNVVELVTNTSMTQLAVYNWGVSDWVIDGSAFGKTTTQVAIADFGTPGATANDFDPGVLDGVAEIVTTNAEAGGGEVNVYTVGGQNVMAVMTTGGAPNESGGPPAIGDVDDDSFPEIVIAGATRIRLFDFDCAGAPAGCESNYVRWSQPSQDSSSRQTGATMFDFDDDGVAEVVYADECFLRIYAGDTGTVLSSTYRNSGTYYDNPVVADVDRDNASEIVVVNDSMTSLVCPAGGDGSPYVDPIDPGARCDSATDCETGATCEGGFCRCTTTAQCCPAGATLEQCGRTCAAAVGDSAPGSNVCRATHPNTTSSRGGILVIRERFDRWASSRPMWNQHAYSVTNINDNGTIPNPSVWPANWTTPGLNSFRRNLQGPVIPRCE